LEARLGEKLGSREGAKPAALQPAPAIPAEDAGESVAAIVSAADGDDGSSASWPDESAESAFLAEARERGEPVVVAKAKEDVADETDSKALPPLNDLVQRIPAEVREVLEDLFRARFVSVKRIPKKALKT
jgi:hypothetical protein